MQPNSNHAPPLSQGNSIYTVGGLRVRYDRFDQSGKAEINVSAFEARDIHLFSFRNQGLGKQVDCIEDVQEAGPISE